MDHGEPGFSDQAVTDQLIPSGTEQVKNKNWHSGFFFLKERKGGR